MKEATGEFSMTVITILAVVFIGTVLVALRGPIQNFIQEQFTELGGGDIDFGEGGEEPTPAP